ncbi:glycosyltransferase [Lentisphaerota bacterium ZTH]|nr:glycosyltransferase [Lentisphaerota bacterium]WET06694.1 glycosyltransferase [Lentisphaerota bacterium ZTH]
MNIGIFTESCDVHQAALWQLLNEKTHLNVKVFSLRDCLISDHGKVGLEQNRCRFKSCRFLKKESFTEKSVDNFFGQERLDVAFVNGCRNRLERIIIKNADKAGCKVILRGIISDDQLRTGDKIFDGYFSRRLLNDIDAFCPAWYKAAFQFSAAGVKPEKIFFSPHIADETSIDFQKREYNRDEIRKFLGINSKDVVFLFEDSMDKASQSMVMAKASAQLAGCENARFLFAGEGAMLERVKAAAPDNSIFVSGREFVESGFLLCAADVLVICSDLCSWSRTANVAMNWELPVIVSDCCIAALDLVIDGYTGYSFHAGDIDSLAVIMKRFIKSPGKAHQMGFAASKDICNYSMRQSAKAIVDAVNYVMEQ